jgi:putative FmdB family regulatory protein
MPMYAYACRSCGERFDLLVPMSLRDEQHCACGQFASRQVTSVAFTGQASQPSPQTSPVPLRRRLPSSWQGVGASREGIAHYQRLEDRLAKHEDRHPELKDNRMPIVAHEGGKIVHATEKAPTNSDLTVGS